jgi:hypothetical protein
MHSTDYTEDIWLTLVKVYNFLILAIRHPVVDKSNFSSPK